MSLQPLWAPRDLLAVAPYAGWSETQPDASHLLLDLRAHHGLNDAERASLQEALLNQPVPVVGFGAAEQQLASAADLLVTTDAELERAEHNIQSNPVAAAVLVQVLRCVGSLPVLQALTMESLAFATLQSGAEFAAWLKTYRSKPTDPPQNAAADIVLLERNGARLDIVLNSPATRNALSVDMRDALVEAFMLVAMDASISSVHVSANGPCFSSGGALEEFGTVPDPATGHIIRMLRMPGRYLAEHGARYHFHVHRACIGAGIELPAFAGRLTATSNTFFQLPELGMGLIPGAGGCVSISRRIGRQRTAYMAILGKKISAGVALSWGLIDAIED